MSDLRSKLIDDLLKCQAYEDHVDIMTITGFMDDADLIKHLTRYQEKHGLTITNEVA